MAGPDSRSPLKQPMRGRDFVRAVAAARLEGQRLAYCSDIVGIGMDASVEDRCSAAAFGLADGGWHTSLGGGIWLSPVAQPYILRAGAGVSDEGTRIYVALGLPN